MFKKKNKTNNSGIPALGPATPRGAARRGRLPGPVHRQHHHPLRHLRGHLPLQSLQHPHGTQGECHSGTDGKRKKIRKGNLDKGKKTKLSDISFLANEKEIRLEEL